ncbi:MAG: SDR family NAD(P)-dependent oxidoreductase [Vulcanimicrobiota bacterium]
MEHPQPFPLLSRLLAPPQHYTAEALRARVLDKTVVVTGASYGIGEALAIHLALAGAKVALTARSEEPLRELRKRILQAGGEADVFPLDLREPESVDTAAGAIESRYGTPDIVIHNAGKSIRRSLLKSLDRPHDFERTIGVNYMGPVRLQLAFLPKMIERRSGHIINVSSVSVRLPPAAYWAAYHCSKTAFDLWIGAAAPELRPKGIGCTSVYFGLVHTRMSAPTKMYRSMPGLTADQAARVICRGLIRNSRIVQPWWLGPAHLVTTPFQRLSEWAQSMILR